MSLKLISFIYFFILVIQTRCKLETKSTHFSGMGYKPRMNNITETDSKTKFNYSSEFILKEINDSFNNVTKISVMKDVNILNLKSSLVNQIENNESIRNSTKNVRYKLEEIVMKELIKAKHNLEVLKQDFTSLTQGQNQLRSELNKAVEAKLKHSQKINSKEIKNEILVLTPSVHSILGSIESIQYQLNEADKNLSLVNEITRNIKKLTRNLVTKKYLSALLAAAKTDSVSPVRMLLPPQDSFMMMQEWYTKDNKENLPQDCADLLISPEKYQMNISRIKSGVHLIQPKLSSHPFFVYCDMETDGGGWTVFQNRYEGKINFYREWVNYKYGFGNITGEFWLGLEKLHLLTSYKLNELLIQLEDFDHKKRKAKYSAFSIGSELEGYRISVLGSYSGNAGDSFSIHAGRKFSTNDLDHDLSNGNCAELHGGAWWYENCGLSSLNGRYFIAVIPWNTQGITWHGWHGPGYSLKGSRMAIRPQMFPLSKKQLEPEPINHNPISASEEEFEDYTDSLY